MRLTPRHAVLPALLLCAALLPACGGDPAPTPPEAERRHTELRDAMQRPLDKAQTVDAASQAQDEARRRELEQIE